MFCSNCGTENKDGSAFCMNCGKPLNQAQPGIQNQPNPVPVPGPGYQEPVGDSGNFSFEKTSKKISSAREYISALATSYLFLASVICYTLVILASLIQARNQYGVIQRIMDMMIRYGYLGNGYSDYDYTQYYNILAPLMGGASVMGIIIKLAPMIIVSVGLWLIFAQARNRYAAGTVGFTVLKVMEWITLIASGLMVVVVTITLLILAIRSSAVFLIAMLLFLAYSSVLLVYHWLVIKTLDNTQRAVNSDRPALPVSMYVIVVTFVLAFFSFVSGFMSGAVFSGLCQTAASVIFGILMIQFNQNMQILIQGGVIDYEENRINISINPRPGNADTPPAGNGGIINPQPGLYEYDDPLYPPNPIIDERGQLPMKEEEGKTQPLDGFDESGETTAIRAMIVDAESGNEIPVLKTPFVIGKDAARADYAMPDQPTVSRVHAQIIERMGSYYLVDLDSTNHTYLNREQIPARQEMPLRDGDEIICARVRFLFRIVA